VPNLDPALQSLVDKQEITEVIMRFARGLDRGDWELVRSCYHDDATDDHGAFKGSADDYVAWLREFLPRFAEATMHAISNVLIELDGDVAHAEAYVIGYHRHAREDGSRADFVGAGRYIDRFERRNGVWKIAARLLVWDWVRDDAVEPGAGDAAWDVVRGRRDRLDAVYTFGRSP
jgi:3-phenylpropionate/cinnamic acid dioxygenase small subunit